MVKSWGHVILHTFAKEMMALTISESKTISVLSRVAVVILDALLNHHLLEENVEMDKSPRMVNAVAQTAVINSLSCGDAAGVLDHILQDLASVCHGHVNTNPSMVDWMWTVNQSNVYESIKSINTCSSLYEYLSIRSLKKLLIPFQYKPYRILVLDCLLRL